MIKAVGAVVVRPQGDGEGLVLLVRVVLQDGDDQGGHLHRRAAILALEAQHRTAKGPGKRRSMAHTVVQAGAALQGYLRVVAGHGVSDTRPGGEQRHVDNLARRQPAAEGDRELDGVIAGACLGDVAAAHTGQGGADPVGRRFEHRGQGVERLGLGVLRVVQHKRGTGSPQPSLLDLAVPQVGARAAAVVLRAGPHLKGPGRAGGGPGLRAGVAHEAVVPASVVEVRVVVRRPGAVQPVDGCIGVRCLAIGVGAGIHGRGGAHHLEEVAATVGDGAVADLGAGLHEGVVGGAGGCRRVPRRRGDEQQPEGGAAVQTGGQQRPVGRNVVGAVAVGRGAFHLRLRPGWQAGEQRKGKQRCAKPAPQKKAGGGRTETVRGRSGPSCVGAPAEGGRLRWGG